MARRGYRLRGVGKSFKTRDEALKFLQGNPNYVRRQSTFLQKYYPGLYAAVIPTGQDAYPKQPDGGPYIGTQPANYAFGNQKPSIPYVSPVKNPTPPAASPTGGKTPPSIAAQAQLIVNGLLKPQEAALNQTFGQQSANIAAAYEALARLRQGIAPSIQNTYQSATQDQASIGKGFSSANQQASDATAAQTNQMLSGLNSPQQVQSGGSGAADALYALGGYIPASQLNREGAAFTAAATNLPNQAAGLGIDALKGLNIEQQKQLLALQNQRPELLLNVSNQLYDRQNQQYQQQADQRDFNYKVWQDQMSVAVAQGAKPQARTLANGQIQWFDARTGKPIGKPQGPTKQTNLTYKNVGGRLYGIDPVTGQPVVDVGPAGTPKPPKKDKPKTLTAGQIATAKKTAGKIAEQAFNGFYASPDAPGVPLSPSQIASMKAAGNEPTYYKLTYQEALTHAMNQGVPLRISQQMLARYWNKGTKGAKVVRTNDKFGGWIYFPEWESPNEGRPLIPVQKRK